MKKDNTFANTPCTKVSWKSMTGDHKKRLCQGCEKNVHNLSFMNESEASKFIREEERCIWYYKRRNGAPIFLPKNRFLARAVSVGLTIIGALSLQSCVAPHIIETTPGPAVIPAPNKILNGWMIVEIVEIDDGGSLGLSAIIKNQYGVERIMTVGSELEGEGQVVAIQKYRVVFRKDDGSISELVP